MLTLVVILNEPLHKIGNEQPTAAIQVDPVCMKLPAI